MAPEATGSLKCMVCTFCAKRALPDPPMSTNQLDKKSQAWSALFSEPMSELVKRYTASVFFDKPSSSHKASIKASMLDWLSGFMAGDALPVRCLFEPQSGAVHHLFVDLVLGLDLRGKLLRRVTDDQRAGEPHGLLRHSRSQGFAQGCG